MILTKTVRIETSNCKKKNHYLSLGYDLSSDFFEAKIEDIPKFSNVLISVKCDICGEVQERTLSEYSRTTNKSDNLSGKWACSKKCGGLKLLENYKLKFGFHSPSHNPEIIEKTKKTNLERWGTEWTTQSEIVLKKQKETNLRNWGVEHVLQNKQIKNKLKESNLNNWGKDNFFETQDFKEKSKKTNLEKWGVESFSKTELFKEKIKKTNLEKWGVETTLQIDKSKKNLKDKLNSETHRKKYFNIANNTRYLNYIGDQVSLFKCDCNKDHNFQIHTDNFISRKKLNLPLCTVCYPIDSHTSISESELLNFIKSTYKGEIIEHFRHNYEIDIYLPDIKIGFEFNGLYWHSDIFRDINYHLNKTIFFDEIGIRIIHIWEDDWKYKREIVESQILNWTGQTPNKIWARDCQVREIENCSLFLEQNHIQGKVNTTLKLGLFYQDELVSTMTFDQSEGRKKMPQNEWNLNRFCNKLNTNIVGGASKLLNHFIKKYKPKRIISYADKDWSRGDLYHKLGFEKVNETPPDYKYIVNSKRIHKSRFRKSVTGISESKLDIPKVWNCGKIKFEIKIPE